MLAIGTGVGVVGFSAALGAVVGVAALVWAWVCRAPARVTCLAVAPLGLAAGVPWPVSGIVAVVLAVILDRSSGRVDFRPDQLTLPGRCAVGEVAAVAALAVPSALLAAAASLGNEHVVLEMSYPGPLPIVGLIVVLAVVNAATEEVLWRSRMMGVLDGVGIPVRAAVIVQAVSFGVAHANGLPGGMLGAGGACVLGIVLGLLRRRPAGLFGCVVVHVLIDIGLFGLAATRMVWVGR